MKNERRKLNDTERREWLEEHFVYSVNLLSRSAELYARRKYDAKAVENTPYYFEYWCIDMALLQTFLTELRNLHDFFYFPIPDQKRFFDDARALDYFETDSEVSQWTRSCPTKSKLFIDSYERIGGTLAHLTYKRDEKYEWKVLSLWIEVYEIIQAFFACMPVSRKGNVPQQLSWLADLRRAFLPNL